MCCFFVSITKLCNFYYSMFRMPLFLILFYLILSNLLPPFLTVFHFQSCLSSYPLTRKDIPSYIHASFLPSILPSSLSSFLLTSFYSFFLLPSSPYHSSSFPFSLFHHYLVTSSSIPHIIQYVDRYWLIHHTTQAAVTINNLLWSVSYTT